MPDDTVFQTPNLFGPAQMYGLTGRFDYKGLDPQQALSERRLDQRQMIANALLNQSAVPRRGKMVGRFYQPASWTEGVGQLGEALASGFISSNIDRERERVQAETSKRVADAIARFESRTAAEPAGTVTRAAQPDVPSNLGEVLQSVRSREMAPTSVRSTEPQRGALVTDALQAQYDQQHRAPEYEMGQRATPETIEVSPGQPVSEAEMNAAFAELAPLRANPQLNDFYKEQQANYREAKAIQRAEVDRLEHIRQFNAKENRDERRDEEAKWKDRIEADLALRRQYEEKRKADEDRGARAAEAEARNATAIKVAEINAAARRKGEPPPKGYERYDDPELGMVYRRTIGLDPWNKELKSAVADRQTLSAIHDVSRPIVKSIDLILDPKNAEALAQIQGSWSSLTTPFTGKAKQAVQDLINARDSIINVSSVQGVAKFKQIAGVSPGSITEREWPRFQEIVNQLKTADSPKRTAELLSDLRNLLTETARRERASYFEKHDDRRMDPKGGIETFDQYMARIDDYDRKASVRPAKQAEKDNVRAVLGDANASPPRVSTPGFESFSPPPPGRTLTLDELRKARKQ